MAFADLVLGQVHEAALRGHRALAVRDGLKEPCLSLAEPRFPGGRVVELGCAGRTAQVAQQSRRSGRSFRPPPDRRRHRRTRPSAPPRPIRRCRRLPARLKRFRSAAARAVLAADTAADAVDSGRLRLRRGVADARLADRCDPARPRRPDCCASSRTHSLRSSSRRSTSRIRKRSEESTPRRTGARKHRQPCSREPPGSFRTTRIWLQMPAVRDKCKCTVRICAARIPSRAHRRPCRSAGEGSRRVQCALPAGIGIV